MLYALNLATIFVLVLLYVVVNRRKPSGYATGREVLVIDAAYAFDLLGAVWIVMTGASP